MPHVLEMPFAWSGSALDRPPFAGGYRAGKMGSHIIPTNCILAALQAGDPNEIAELPPDPLCRPPLFEPFSDL